MRACAGVDDGDDDESMGDENMMGMSTKYEHEDETYVVNDTNQKQKFQNSCLARLHCMACLGNVVKTCVAFSVTYQSSPLSFSCTQPRPGTPSGS